MKTISELLGHIPQTGRVEWIGASPHPRAMVTPLLSAQVSVGIGLDEDHHARSGRSKRQVTLIQWEHLRVVAGILGRDTVSPELLRRNIAVSGINLLALKKQQFRIGDVLLEWTGYCHPCSRMEEVLGPGGYQAMRGHGGITARVLAGGEVRLGEQVLCISTSTVSDEDE